LETHFDKWIYFLKNLESFDHIPAILNEPIFQKAFETAELANLSREQYTAYEQNLLDYWGVRASVVTAREEGRQESRVETAIKMLADGLDDAAVMKYTGLSADVLASLKKPPTSR
jgi:predicted transposase/invertase (TIGR01784 family)